jgi:hypothetical protein
LFCIQELNKAGQEGDEQDKSAKKKEGIEEAHTFFIPPSSIHSSSLWLCGEFLIYQA